MKRVIISIVATVCVMAIGCGIHVNRIERDYEARLDETSAIYEQRISELEDSIYYMRNGYPYDVVINHDDSTYRYVH